MLCIMLEDIVLPPEEKTLEETCVADRASDRRGDRRYEVDVA